MKMISRWRAARALLFLAALPVAAHAATYYVSPSGSDSSSGTLAAPFGTLQRAVSLAVAGDTIYMRGGTYTLSSAVNINRSGSSGNYISIINYPGEQPVLDGIALTNENDSNLQLNSASWWRVQGIESKNAPSHGIYLTGASSNDIVEQCVTHHNVRLRSSGGGGGILVDGTSSNNLIENNDSHHNGNATISASAGDGIEVNYTQATGNVVRGNRSWRNNDDGFDLWNAANVLVEDNWSWENGYNDSLQPTPGNGTGFKLGGPGAGAGRHTVRNNVAWRNSHNGFDDNSATVPLTLYNNTAFQNTGRSFAMYIAMATVLKNNAEMPSGSSFTTSSDVQDHNTWNLGISAASSDFASLDYSGATGPRNPDGSLPNINFLKLAAGSNLIDKGVNVGLPYVGSAPDLGAYEYGSSLPAPTGLKIMSSSP